MRILFAGTPEFAVLPLRALIEAGFDVAAVITQEDKPTGRGGKVMPPAVKIEAEALGLKVLQYDKIKNYCAELRTFNADALITCAYGQLLTQEVLDVFPKGVLNVHASLLPAFRGAAPIQAAILNGDTVFGVTVMRTALSLDSGDIILKRQIEITENLNCAEITYELSRLGATAICEALELLKAGKAVYTPQNEGLATYCKKVKTEDCILDFHKTANNVYNEVRAFSPKPGATADTKYGKLKLLKAEIVEDNGGATANTIIEQDKRGIVIRCGENAIRPLTVQSEGGKIMSASDYFRGHRLEKGEKFTV
jgi:methionyl-tRNA formyltransferase